jgi:hypothetical protein
VLFNTPLHDAAGMVDEIEAMFDEPFRRLCDVMDTTTTAIEDD